MGKKNTYHHDQQDRIYTKLLGHLKHVRLDQKSLLVGMATSFLVSGTAGHLFSDFTKMDVFTSVSQNSAMEGPKTSALFFAARYNLFPEGFDQWALADETGWTVAHEAATYGHLPEGLDFSLLKLADRHGVTVASIQKRVPQETQTQHADNKLQSSNLLSMK